MLLVPNFNKILNKLNLYHAYERMERKFHHYLMPFVWVRKSHILRMIGVTETLYMAQSQTEL